MSKRLLVLDTPLPGLKTIDRDTLKDTRGFFERLFCIHELSQHLQSRQIVQINHTLTVNKGTVRGMHYQTGDAAETKIVTCIRGEVFDVAIDVRKGSPTYLSWHSVILSESNFRSFLIPEGFAHGLQTLSDNCELLYFHTKTFNSEAEAGLNPKDPRLNINWPLQIRDLSERDANLPMFPSL